MSQKLKDQSLSPELQAAALGSRSAATARVETADLSEFDDRIRRTLLAAWEKKALDLTVLDLREIASFTDFFVIATGTNKRQVQAISDEVVEQLKRSGTRAARVEGYQTAEWILVDYGDFVVHVFDDKARRFYDLERLWRESKRVDVSAEQLGSLRTE
ncbi:MAG TPA: ribosome silencing factor [Pyrinomonadaceae bacterium]|nr:ribosome silencing factor [Pyrinomonadaceae bacterium]